MNSPNVGTVTVIALSVTPGAVTLQPGATQQFQANTSGTWVIQEGAAGGTITPTGLYTAPPTPGTFHVTLVPDGAPPVIPPVNPTTPPLHVSGATLLDPHGNRVILRGLSSQGMCMVYGDKANPGIYLPMSVADYVKRAVQTDAAGARWYSRAIRLCFERFPSTATDQLDGYVTEGQPYSMPDTIPMSPWQPQANVVNKGMVTSGGKRYRVIERKWRADKGAHWNPGAYVVGDVVSSWHADSGHPVYRCTAVPASVTLPPNPDWAGGPSQGAGSSTDIFGNTWLYIGEFGTTGTVELSTLTPVTDNHRQWWIDGFAAWQYVSPDYSAAQAQTNFADWVAKVLDPSVQAAVDAGLYAVVTDFDFGPANHPLRQARMLAFWQYMATSRWANHPQVLFELWNECCDVGTVPGGGGSWAAQKPAIQQTVDAVRAAGAQNVIIIPPPFFSAWIGEATASPLNGTNLAYAWHQYRDQFENYGSNRDQFAAGAASGQCVIVTEWGDGTTPLTDPAKTWWDFSSATPLKKLLEPSEGAAHPVAGWFAWALTDSWSPNLFLDRALTQPTVFGTGTRNALASKQADSQPGATERVKGGRPRPHLSLRDLGVLLGRPTSE